MDKEIITAHGLIKNVFIYDGLDDDTINIYRSFESDFRNRFDDYAKLFNVEKPYFYISNDDRCNAFATKANEYNIVSITNGYPILLKQKFNKAYLQNFFLAGIINDSSLSNAYVELAEETDFKIDDFFINCSYTFTFSHEFQHILQFKHDTNTEKNYQFQEQLSNMPFDFRKHVWEFDADRIASFEVLKYAYRVFSKLQNKSNEILKVILFIASATMFITNCLFCLGISNQIIMPFRINKTEFYLAEKSHPHPLVRCLNILEYFYDNISSDFAKFEINFQALFNNVIGITKIFFDSLLPRNNAIELIFKDFDLHLSEINQYNQILYDAAIKDKAIKRILISRGIDFQLH